MFGSKSIHDQYEKVISEIQDGKRRDPKHEIAGGLRGKWDRSSAADPVDQYAFDELAWFGAALDHGTGDAWSLEETADTMRRAWYLDSPSYGRRWIIYYNALKLGWIEVSATPLKVLGTVDEFRADPMAQLDISLGFMRFVPHDVAFGLLYQASFLMQSVADGYDAARERARSAAESAMVRHIWEVMRAGDQYVPDFDFSAEGPYDVFREMTAHWKQSGFDPLTYKKGE